MMTLEEAIAAWHADPDRMADRHRSVCDQVSRDPELLLMLLALRDSHPHSTGLLTALRIGLMLGIEMEKAR